MNKITTLLFDFDGVVADTEPFYNVFWGQVGEDYKLGIDNFPRLIKGTTLDNIFAVYFKDKPVEFHREIRQACADLETGMDFPPVAGSVEFIALAKERGFKVGLVTSSPDTKMERALKLLNLEGVFDTIVTADRISKGKPDPMCFLTGASDLQAEPGECVVFEDSFSGIQAGTAAGMRIVGLSTTNTVAALQDKVYAVIPDFSDADAVFELLK